MNYKLHPTMNIFILVVSIGMVVFTTWQLYQSINLKYNSNKTDGIITGYYTKEGEAKFRWNRKPVYAPVFKYTDENEEIHEVITSNYKKEMKYEKGDTVTVYYNSDSPKKAQIDDSFPWLRDITLFVFGILGVFFTLLPILGKKG